MDQATLQQPRRLEVEALPAPRPHLNLLTFPAPRSGYERWVKPALDRLGAVVAILLLLPVLAVVALAIRMTMGPGVLFRQRRVGRGGEVFTTYKFRTMGPDRRDEGEAGYIGPERRVHHKPVRHPLVTPLGRLLRGSSLDELPQLWNVLRGDMSLVGPRPELLSVVDGYEAWQHRRHDVKPGITGLWQISARNDGPMEQHTEIDLAYVDRMSLRTDLGIVARTVPAMLGRQRGF